MTSQVCILVMAVVPIGGDVFVSPSLYERATELYGEDVVRRRRGNVAMTIRQVAVALQVHRRDAERLWQAIRDQQARIAEHLGYIHDEAMLAFSPPAADLYPDHRRANGQISHPLPWEHGPGDRE